ncbi:hypothetical protein RhiJN_01422 [Ceratobasidium sp. AG-Ba]|nr:hypothetical protein RhiJN_01422 [Ceratobasidium sp. AG-Ba]QRW02412.1 hypothetical protein RhiLY_01410 [Ceratobasidium sp. AG-Ba]
MQLPNHHKRLVRRLLPRFSPTWLGDPEPTSTVAVGPPAAVTPNPAPTPTPTPTPPPPPPAATPTPVQTSTPQEQSQPIQQTTPAQTSATPTEVVPTTSSTPLTTSTDAPSTTSTSSLVVPTTSSTPVVQVTTPRASVAQTTPVPGTLTVKPATVRSFTNSNGGVVYSTVFATETPEPSASAAPSSGNTGTIVGAVAGVLVGGVCLIAFIAWLVRMHNKRKNGNDDDFDRQSYLRNSMMIPDDAPGAGRPVIGTQAALALARANTSAGPRPPTMIERKATYGMHGGQPSPSFAPGQVVSFDPGQVVPAPPSAGNAYPSPVAFAAYTPPAEHHQSELVRRPSGATLLTRQPTNGAIYNQGYQQGSPVSYSPDGYYPHHDGYTYLMGAERGMVQSVTPYQAQQYAEITRQLEGNSNDHSNDSFHPISPIGPSPVGYAVSDDAHPIDENLLANPFDEKALPRVTSTPPSLPPMGIEEGKISRTGTPIDPNPQHAHWSYDAKGTQPGSRLSVTGMPTPPPAAHTREEKTVVVGNGEAMPAQPVNGRRPVSIVDEEDIYGGM